MQTYYTEGIEDGTITTAKEFLMKCFGNFFYESDEYGLEECIRNCEERLQLKLKHLEKLKKQKDEFTNLSYDKQLLLYIQEEQESLEKTEKSIKQQIDLDDKYHKIKSEIDDWDCPIILTELKNFALDQLNSCLTSSLDKEDDENVCNQIKQNIKYPEIHFDKFIQNKLMSYDRQIKDCEHDIIILKGKIKYQIEFWEAFKKEFNK